MVTKQTVNGKEQLVLGVMEWVGIATFLLVILSAVLGGAWAITSKMADLSGRVYSVEAKMELMHEDVSYLKHHDHK